MESCKNCSSAITANFCGNCGQRRYRRINRSYLAEEVQYSFIHMNKGFWHSVKKIFLNPGRSAREFIDGNRVNYYKPLTLAFLLSGIAAFLAFQIIGLTDSMIQVMSDSKPTSPFQKDLLIFTTKYNSLLWLLMIPFFALISKLAFRKWGHNYYEHIVMNAFIASFYMIVCITIIYPVLLFLKSDAPLLVSISQISLLTFIPILIWFFISFYYERPVKSVFGKVLLVFLYNIIFCVILCILMMLVVVVLTLIDPEAMGNYVLPR